MIKKNILIVGASSGLGFEIFKHYASEENSIFILTKNISRLKKNIKKIKIKKNFKYSYIDLSTNKDINSIILSTKNYFKNKIDLVIHVAGGGLGFREYDIKYSNLLKVLNLNILSQIEINKKIIPLMKKRKKGIIIHISSIAGFEAVGSVAYNISKAALNAYVRTMGRQVAKFGIVLTGIAPGGFIANDNAMHRLKNKNKKIYNQFIYKRLPRNKMGNVKEILPLISFLGSDNSGMMSGCIAPIDGGEGKFY